MLSRRARLLVLAVGGAALLVAAGAVAYFAFPAGPEHSLRKARQALERGDRDTADRLAEALQRRGCPDHELLLRGLIWVTEGRNAVAEADGPVTPLQQSKLKKQAQQAFRKGLRHLSRVQGDGALAGDATVLAAECLVRLERHGLAAEGLRSLVQARPDQKEAHRWLAAIYMDVNSPLEAVKHLRELGRLEPEEGRPYRWMGLFYKTYNRAGEAVEAYAEAASRRLDPSLRVDVVKEWAEVLLAAQADYQEALAVLDGCPESARERPDVLTLRAQCLWGLGRAEEAAQLAERASRADPPAQQALVLRARIHSSLDRPKEAVPLLEEALRLDPHDLAARQQLMDVYRQVGDQKKAEAQRLLADQTRQLKDQATKLHHLAVAKPWDDQVRFELAQLCRKLHRPAEARMWLRATLACNPTHGLARQMLAEMTARGEASNEASAGPTN